MGGPKRKRRGRGAGSSAGERDLEGVRLEVFHHLFAAAAEEMGAALMRSSFSPNIKERRDFSCAVFDAEGRTVAQAAHLPSPAPLAARQPGFLACRAAVLAPHRSEEGVMGEHRRWHLPASI